MIRALVVDDDIIICEKHRKVLEELGCEVVVRNSAEDALKLLKKDSKFQAIFSDFAMPGMNGYQLSKEVSDKISSSIKIFIVTKYHQSEFGNSQYKEIDDLIEKPMTEDVARDALQRHRLIKASPKP